MASLRDPKLWIFLGVALLGAAIIDLSIWATAACEVPGRRLVMKASGGTGCVEFWLNRYQSLIGALATLAAAALAFLAVKRQLDWSQAIESGRRDRDAIAARSVLPLALDALSAFCEGCIKEIDLAAAQNRSLLQLPVFPDHTIETLKIVVREATDDRRLQVAELVAICQIVIARLRRPSPAEFADRVIDLADLYVRIDRLYGYGRISLDRHSVSAIELRRAIILVGANDADPAISARIDLRERAQHERKSAAPAPA